MHILALSGSLRAASINSAFCRAAAQLGGPKIEVLVYAELGSLPLFNPDLESSPPAAVAAFRHEVGRAGALLIASPEYAHGISGPMKNALDWLVSYEGAVDKPVALVNTSPRAHHAIESTQEILRTMNLALMDGASRSIPLLANCTTTVAMLSSPQIRAEIGAVLAEMAEYLNGRRAG